MIKIPKTRILEMFELFKQNGGYCFIIAFNEKDGDAFETDSLVANINEAFIVSYLEIQKLRLLRRLERAGARDWNE